MRWQCTEWNGMEWVLMNDLERQQQCLLCAWLQEQLVLQE